MDTPIFDGIAGNANSNPVGNRFLTFSDFFGVALNVLMGLSFGVSAIALIMAGVQFIMSEGDAKGIQTAKKYLTVGVFAVFMSLAGFAIKRMLLRASNVTETNLVNPRPNL